MSGRGGEGEFRSSPQLQPAGRKMAELASATTQFNSARDMDYGVSCLNQPRKAHARWKQNLPLISIRSYTTQQMWWTTGPPHAHATDISALHGEPNEWHCRRRGTADALFPDPARAHHRIAQVEDPSPPPGAFSPAAEPTAFSPPVETPGQSRQAQCWPSGICRCTDATWRPHPAHVGLPHVPHFTW